MSPELPNVRSLQEGREGPGEEILQLLSFRRAPVEPWETRHSHIG